MASPSLLPVPALLLSTSLTYGTFPERISTAEMGQQQLSEEGAAIPTRAIIFRNQERPAVAIPAESETGTGGNSHDLNSSISFGNTCRGDLESGALRPLDSSRNKKRRISLNPGILSCEVVRELGVVLPTLRSHDYYMEPCLEVLASQELVDPGFSSRVPNFAVGRSGYGFVKFLDNTDVRGLDLDKIVKFERHEVVVYEDESAKPAVGKGLNKAAEVTLILQTGSSNLEERRVDDIVEKLRQSTTRQEADFISFNPVNGEWKFLVQHFSRFGLSDDDEDDIIMDDAAVVQDPIDMSDNEISDMDKGNLIDPTGTMLSHSLPTHLGLDPVSMKEMMMVLYPNEEDDEQNYDEIPSRHKPSFGKGHIKSPMQFSNQRMNYKSSPPVARKTPLALLEYNPGSFDSSLPGTILMAQQNKGHPVKTAKAEGFKLDPEHETPVAGSHSRNIVDAGLFMGRSFRVGWGPNGILVHSGMPVGSNDSPRLSSVICMEKVATDRVVRDENNKERKELVDFAFDSPLSLHKEINHETKEVEVGSFKLKLQKLVSNRLMLSDICRSYIEIAEKQLEVSGISSSTRLMLMHQVMVWELIRVLFSERENSGQSKSVADDNEEDMMQDMKEGSSDPDLEALPLMRRAEFSFWLQESVCHRVQDDVSSLNESSYLEHIFLLLTGRQLDAAVELAASKGDVRLACLLSQAGGSPVNRSDVARQLELWRINGLDFNFIEKERIKLYELLASNIHSAVHDVQLDWKRFLGLLMWYRLSPDTSLSNIFHTYQQLLVDGRAPYPVPMYVDEDPVEVHMKWSSGDRFDLLYYLMLLHANEGSEIGFLKTMFSAFSSTYDPLDYHMLWHQRMVLEAVGAFSSNDLHVLDMGLVSQLLCLGQCHWAIYVVLHMSYRDDYPYLQSTVIREILFQYCESWSKQESQRQFIEDLGVPSTWLHEALAVYYDYYGDRSKALEHFIKCGNWQKAHSIFISSVAHELFLSAKHSEAWDLATSMEGHKSEIANWDFGAGVYISFYLLKSTMQEDSNTMTQLDALENKNAACRDLINFLNGSLATLGDKLPINARVAYSKMSEEICSLLLSDMGEDSTREDQLNCFDTVFSAPVPEDIRSGHFQDMVALFTCYISEVAT